MAKYLTSKEVAEMIGVSVRALDIICMEGRITYYRPGKSRLFKLEDVEAYVDGGKVKAIA